MEWIVTTGRTVAEAVEAALDELGVDEADIEYEILEESKRGFLSRLGGGSPARIKARVKPLSREKPDRRRRSGGRERDRDRKGGDGGGSRGERAAVEVVDLKSTNGTFVNDKRIERATIAAGDRLRVGRVELHIQRS